MAASADTVEDARAMIRSGENHRALAVLDSIIKIQPKNADVEMARGECLVAMNNDADAIVAFNNAVRKGSNDAQLSLAEIAVRQYRVDDADDYIDAYRSYIQKNRRKKLTDMSGDIDAQLSKTRAMLDRVEKITVIDSIIVDDWQFFEAYRLSPESGSIHSIEVLPMGFHYSLPTSVYTTEDGRRMIWAAQDSADNFILRASDRLVGDSWDAPASIGNHLGNGGDANYPFLMPDGITLYYASDGEGTLGGYDIFVSRLGSDGFLQPQNIGMPYNSPYDDYLLAIDEMTGVGWWATDRNRIEGKVTIYLFIPSDMRINVDIDDPTLIDRARLTSIRSTWENGTDYSGLLTKVASIIPSKSSDKPQFVFPMPDGRTITRLDQFSNDRAREVMQRYLSIKRDIEQTDSELAELRTQYAGGDTSVASDILTREKQIKELRGRLTRTANDVIKAER